MKVKLRQGDEVAVMTGAHKGSKGKVLRIDRSKMRVFVEGVALVKHHQKATQESPKGSIVEREASLHYSNLKLLTPRAQGAQVQPSQS